MILFGDWLVNWWQAGLIKVALIVLGIMLGATWPMVFKSPLVWRILWLVFIIFALILIITLRSQIF